EMANSDVHTAADPVQEQSELAQRLGKLAAPDDEPLAMLATAAVLNLLDGFARRAGAEAAQHAAAILVRGVTPPSVARSARSAAVGSKPGLATESVYSDPVFLANARTLTGDRDRIVGGIATGDFPDCVAIGSADGWCCSGTLVASNVVVTAGHCDRGA